MLREHMSQASVSIAFLSSPKLSFRKYRDAKKEVYFDHQRVNSLYYVIEL